MKVYSIMVNWILRGVSNPHPYSFPKGKNLLPDRILLISEIESIANLETEHSRHASVNASNVTQLGENPKYWSRSLAWNNLASSGWNMSITAEMLEEEFPVNLKKTETPISERSLSEIW